jgi:hypothetical protein
MDPEPAEKPLLEAERIAYAYRVAARGDTWVALVCAIRDALTDLAEAERRAELVQRQVPRGYVRGRFDQPGR